VLSTRSATPSLAMAPDGAARGTILGSIALLVKSTIGAGILAIPGAFVRTGYLGGPLLLAAIAVVMFGSMQVLERATVKGSGGQVYHGIVKEHLGDTAGMLAEFTVAVYQLLTCCSFIVIIGDAFEPAALAVLPETAADFSRCLAMLVFSLPGFLLCFYPRLAQLSCWMVFGVCVVTVIAMVIVGSFLEAQKLSETVEAWPKEWPAAGESAATFAFALQAHITAPRVFSELSDELHRASWVITSASSLFVITLYSFVGSCGYRLFGNETRGNIILDYKHSAVWYVLSGFNGVQAVFGYALNHYMARSALYDVLLRLTVLPVPKNEGGSLEPMLASPQHEIPQPARARLTVFVYLAALFVASIFGDLGKLSSFIGATAGSLVIFIFPGFLSWKLIDKAVAALLWFAGSLCFFFGVNGLLS